MPHPVIRLSIVLALLGSLSAVAGCRSHSSVPDVGSSAFQWRGTAGAAPAAPASTVAATQYVATDVRRALDDPSVMVALVGDQPVYSGDLLPTINQMLEAYVGQVPEDQLEQQREALLRQLLKNKIDTKLMYIEFLRQLPAKNRAERLAEIKKRVDEQFYTDQIERLKERGDVSTAAELDAKLRSYGSSLEAVKRDFGEQMIARTVIGHNVDREPDVTHQELLDAYNAKLADYDVPARARWERLTARYDRFPDRASAERAIVDMGNEVLRGAPLSAVAKRRSHGSNAASGGYHDWTTRGSLVSTVLDEAIFTLPLMRLSQPLADEQGFHIIRVLEREEATRVPFTEAQEEIRERLAQEKIQADINAYVERVKHNTRVWTIFDSVERSTFNVQR